ncbi:bifunctional metallophosphatase/5'-nucleotidase [Cystobacter ferrugineus]|uniref:Bifunctional metallophosphatase/5'-nucleotidase n=1 Tax=Cystobacter ferrugineus TaxID=83449 RepID=A0A1L9BK67_9BACT|nr:bifunctional metallophosphatase/5'-nucleotidase [Cystobacter ferrugineus]OJH42661.1 bifunctional metallophosphatase/5'-nucleotidase [Cystobacter ferrugineus]
MRHMLPRSLPRPLASCAALLASLLCACAHLPGARPSATQERSTAPAKSVLVRILGINDFHGNLAPPPGPAGEVRTGRLVEGKPERVEAGGAAWLASHLSRLRAEPSAAHHVVVSSGDLIGASPLLSALFHDEPTIEAMNLMGLTLHGVGNHEFDEGLAELRRMRDGGCHPVEGCQGREPFGGARFEFLAANVVDEKGATVFPAYALREFEGVKVAFIGMTLQGTAEIVDATGIQGLRFLDEADTVNALVPELKKQGVRAIVVLVHEGGVQKGPGASYDGCEGLSGPIVDIVHRLDPEVDAVLSAHTHQAYNCVLDGKRVTSAASAGRLITHLELVLDAASGDVVDSRAHNVIVTREGAGDPAVGALVERYERLSAPLRERVIGRVAQTLRGPDARQWPSGESPLGNMLSDAQLAATREAGAQVSFMNPGGIRGELAAGDVTYGEAFTVQPFGNSLVTLTLTGEQLRRLLEEQWVGDYVRILNPSRGFSYTWKDSAPVGQKVDPASLRLNGVPIEPAGHYRVTVSSFLAGGGDGFRVFAQGTERKGGPSDLEALESWLKAQSPLSAPETNRLTRVP